MPIKEIEIKLELGSLSNKMEIKLTDYMLQGFKNE